MTRKLFLLLTMIFLCYNLFPQGDIQLTKPELIEGDNKLLIKFNIKNSQRDDWFRIWVEIRDHENNEIRDLSISGDVGSFIPGSKTKSIVWDYVNDSLFDHTTVKVRIFAERMDITQVNVILAENFSYSLAKPILLATVIPGAGITHIKEGGAYWLIGVLDYGLLAGSIYYNRKSLKTYDQYLDSPDIEASTKNYNDALMYDRYSQSMAIAAGGVWAANMIWTIFEGTTYRLKMKNSFFNKSSMMAGLNPITNTPVVMITYKF